VLLVTLPLTLRAFWKKRRQHPAMTVLGLAALAYPATLALRLSAAGTETSNRSSEFVFVGLGAGLGLALVATRWTRDAHGRRFTILGKGLLAAVAGLLVVGGLTVGWAPYARLPGPYLPGAGLRSVDPPGITAARWEGEHLQPHAHMFGDETSVLLATAYGNLDPQGGVIDGFYVPDIFLSPRLGSRERTIIAADKIRYLVVDDRLSEATPASGRYFLGGDPRGNTYRHPISARKLNKFERIPALDLLFSDGPVQIYDATRIVAAR
jgi:hypothetical protein